MAGITLAQAEAQLALYLAAEAAVLDGQSVQWGARALTRANLAEIRKGRQEWQVMVNAEAAQAAKRTGPRVLLADFSGPV